VTIGPPNPLGTARRGRLRASDADREHVIETLKTAFVQGRLTKDELDHRVGQTFVSRTYAELAALTADIPAGSAALPRRPKPTPVPARQARRPANKKANTWALVVVAHIPVAMIVVAAIIGSEGLAQAASPMLYAYFWFVLMAVAHLVDSRLKKRAHR
jgi:Domain of unknown function (DUF1707)